MSVAKEGGLGGGGSGLYGRVVGFMWFGLQIMILQSAENHGKTHANQCKSMQIRLQIKTLFPKPCKAHANHDLRLDLQLANHDLQSANHV